MSDNRNFDNDMDRSSERRNEEERKLHVTMRPDGSDSRPESTPLNEGLDRSEKTENITAPNAEDVKRRRPRKKKDSSDIEALASTVKGTVSIRETGTSSSDIAGVQDIDHRLKR